MGDQVSKFHVTDHELRAIIVTVLLLALVTGAFAAASHEAHAEPERPHDTRPCRQLVTVKAYK
jgi:hypothetical protein